jgi:16S rRNA processing protein RimM
MANITLGEITKTFGLDGGIKVYSLTSFKDARFKVGNSLLVTNPENKESEKVTVSSYRDSGAFVFLSFKEWTSIEEAEKHLHYNVEIEEAKAPLPKGYYRYRDLVGCTVKDEKGVTLGFVKEVLTNAPTANLRVSQEGKKDFFVPFLMKEFIQTIDIKNKVITIKVIPGLLG